jgi:hypothetical protein
VQHYKNNKIVDQLRELDALLLKDKDTWTPEDQATHDLLQFMKKARENMRSYRSRDRTAEEDVTAPEVEHKEKKCKSSRNKGT